MCIYWRTALVSIASLPMFPWLLVVTSDIAEKARAAQRQRQAAKKREKEVAEMETDD